MADIIPFDSVIDDTGGSSSGGIPSFIPFEQVHDDISQSPDPSMRDYAMGAIKGVGRGALDLFTAPADLLYRGVNYLGEKTGVLDPISQEQLMAGLPSARAKQMYDYISSGALDDPNWTPQAAPQGNETAEDVARGVTNLATMIAVPSQGANIASKIPLIGKSEGLGGLLSKAIGYGTEGAGLTALSQSAEADPFKNAEYGAGLNMLFPALGSTVSGIAGKFGKSADALERSAAGATPGDFVKSIKYKGATGLGTEQVGSKLAQTIKNIGQEGAFAGAKDPADLMNFTVGRIGELSDSLDPIITKADELIKAKGYKVYPKWTEAQKFVDEANPKETAELQKMLDETIAAYRGRLDGSVSSMHDLKKVIYKSSYTDAGKAKDVLDTAIAKDLKRSIENATDSVLAKEEAGVIKATNARIGDYLDYKKIAGRQLGKEEGKNIGKTAASKFFTTGGVGAPAVLGAVIGGQESGTKGAITGALSGIALQRLGQPGGQFALSKILRGLGGPVGKVGAGISAGGRLGSVLTGDLSRTPTSESKKNISLSNAIQESKPMPEEIKKPAFDAKLDKVATNIGIRPEDLRQVIKFETGGSMSPSKRNPDSDAVGLIQFIGPTAKALTGLDTEKEAKDFLASMSAEDQLDYVEKHIKPYAGQIKTFEDLYMAILKPVAIGKPNSYPLFKEGSTAYDQNKGLDIDQDGIVTKLEAAKKAREA